MNYSEKGVQHQLRASGIARRRTEPGWRAAVLDEHASGGVLPLRATTAAADSRCSRRRSAGGEAEQRFSVLAAPTKTAATQRTSPRAERTIQYLGAPRVG